MNSPALSDSAGRSGAPPSFRTTVLVTALLAAPAVVLAFWPGLAGALAYERVQVATGEWWRVLTSHWTHWSFDHLGWDLLAFVVLVPLCLHAGAKRFWTTLVLSAALIPLAVHVLLPGMTSYRGLSGLDSALFVLLATVLFRRYIAERAWMPAVVFASALAGFGLKVGFELATGTAVFVEAAGFIPVPLAHVVGGIAGGLVGCVGRCGSGRVVGGQLPRRSSASSFL